MIIRQWSAFILVFGFGCIQNAPTGSAYELDPNFHRCRVQPIVDRGCAMLACHGDASRPFHSFSRNRMRIVGENIQRNLPLSSEELTLNYDSARAFAAELPGNSWLLLKPLDESAGGYYHRGRQIFAGPDVYTSVDDPDYIIIEQWLGGAAEDPGCTYAGVEQP